MPSEQLYSSPVLKSSLEETVAPTPEKHQAEETTSADVVNVSPAPSNAGVADTPKSSSETADSVTDEDAIVAEVDTSESAVTELKTIEVETVADTTAVQVSTDVSIIVTPAEETERMVEAVRSEEEDLVSPVIESVESTAEDSTPEPQVTKEDSNPVVIQSDVTVSNPALDNALECAVPETKVQDSVGDAESDMAQETQHQETKNEENISGDKESEVGLEASQLVDTKVENSTLGNSETESAKDAGIPEVSVEVAVEAAMTEDVKASEDASVQDLVSLEAQVPAPKKESRFFQTIRKIFRNDRDPRPPKVDKGVPSGSASPISTTSKRSSKSTRSTKSTLKRIFPGSKNKEDLESLTEEATGTEIAVNSSTKSDSSWFHVPRLFHKVDKKFAEGVTEKSESTSTDVSSQTTDLISDVTDETSSPQDCEGKME